MGDEKDSSNPEVDATRIDLGEDLLEKTAMISVVRAEPVQIEEPESVAPSSNTAPSLSPKLNGPLSSEKIVDSLESAKILLSEGFADDAKKILHQVLIVDSGNAVARQALTEIHELELKQIFGEGEIRRPYGRKAEIPEAVVDSEELMKRLDKDLGLGLSNKLSLFENQDLMDAFCAKLEKDLTRAMASPQDWIDLGIAFLEMDLFSVAERLFLGASRRLDPEDVEDRRNLLSATCLLALSLILSGRPFDAVSRIQPLLRDPEIKREDKIELFYLMGRTYESMNRMDLAYYYYQQVMEIDPHYRDIDDRLKAV